MLKNLLQISECSVSLAMIGAFFLPIYANAQEGFTEVVGIDFNEDTPGQPPATGGPGQPSYLVSQSGTSILVQASANGITTQPVVLTVQGADPFADVHTRFDPVSEGIVRVEATVSFDRLEDGYFLQTTAGSGTNPTAVVTRLITRDFGEIQDHVSRTRIGTYLPNEPFRIRVDIDMSANTWSATVDNELNGFEDDPTISGLPFQNPVNVLPTVGGVSASLNLFPTLSVAPTSVAYDDIRVLVPITTVLVDIKPGSYPNSINPRSRGRLPVAILTTDTFDASTIEPTTIRFGAVGTETAPAKWALEDIDGDGDQDLILHFETQDTGIECGVTSATLTGETTAGRLFEGQDSVNTVGCR